MWLVKLTRHAQTRSGETYRNGTKGDERPEVEVEVDVVEMSRSSQGKGRIEYY